MIGVDDFFGFEFAVEDGERLARFGIRRVEAQSLFEIFALLRGVVGDLTEVEIGLFARIPVIGQFQGAFQITARGVVFFGLQVDDSFT